MSEVHPSGTIVPTIGRIVWYRSRTGNYTVPAIVTATKATLWQPGVEQGHVPALDSDLHVHLTVFTPGKPGKRGDAKDFVAREDAPISENVSGCYQEWNVPFSISNEALYADPAPGCWTWPARV